MIIAFQMGSFCANAQMSHIALSPVALSKIKNGNIVFLKHTSTYNHQMLTIASFSVTPDYYTKNFGFFCKQELKLEKCVRTPVHIRLGDVKYVNWLEQKGTYNYPAN